MIEQIAIVFVGITTMVFLIVFANIIVSLTIWAGNKFNRLIGR